MKEVVSEAAEWLIPLSDPVLDFNEKGVHKMYAGVKESDWKLFRKKLPEWQEAHMEKLIQEYAALLAGPGLASDRFWKLEERINSDKHHSGVIVDCMSQSNMYRILFELANDKVIGAADLEEFSDELRERLTFYLLK